MFRHVTCETLVDEPYHLLLVENDNRLTRFHRDLAHIRIPSFNLVRFMEIEKARYNEDWQRILIQLATSVVSEIFVSDRSEEHTSELQSLMRISYAVFCLKKKKLNRCNSLLLIIIISQLLYTILILD